VAQPEHQEILVTQAVAVVQVLWDLLALLVPPALLVQAVYLEPLVQAVWVTLVVLVQLVPQAHQA
jgi:hypothetical protein